MKRLKFDDEVYCFRTENDPLQKSFHNERCLLTGTFMNTYKGIVIGIKKMKDGKIFYVVEGNGINIFNRKYYEQMYGHKTQVEISSDDVFLTENKLRVGINKRGKEVRESLKIQHENMYSKNC